MYTFSRTTAPCQGSALPLPLYDFQRLVCASSDDFCLTPFTSNGSNLPSLHPNHTLFSYDGGESGEGSEMEKDQVQEDEEGVVRSGQSNLTRPNPFH